MPEDLVNRRGFTLIELMTVFGILSVLASIAIIKSGQQKERALRTTMVSDLRNLVPMQEAFFSSNGDYAGGLTAGPTINRVRGRGRISFVPSGANVITVRRRPTGWNATATNPGLRTAPRRCGIFSGPVSNSPNRNVRVEGVPACW